MNRVYRAVMLAAIGGTLGACATAPAVPVAPTVTFEQKMAWMLRLEDQRILREPPPPPAPPVVPARGTRAVVVPEPPPVPDLGRLIADEEVRVRRRAALAIGRVGMAAGVDLLLPRLADPEPEVRQMAAFALGLLNDRRAIAPLRAALTDPSPLVQGRAAEALGLIGDQASAPAVATMVGAIVRSGAMGRVAPEEVGWPLEPSVEAFRLGVYALARLNAFDAAAGVLIGANGQAVVQWWPVAYALARMPDTRAAAALTAFVRGGGQQARLFGARGLGALKDPASVDVLVPFAEAWRKDVPTAIAAVRALAGMGHERAAAPLASLVRVPDLPANLRLEVVAALGALHAMDAVPALLDLVTDAWPPLRAAALRALRDIDLQQFLLVLSGLEPDRAWSVRAAVATLMGTLPPDMGVPRLVEMLEDPDQRVIPSVLDALVTTRAREAEPALLERLRSDDPFVRAAAATGLGTLKPAAGEAALVQAVRRAQSDAIAHARVGALSALAKYGAAAATPLLKEALQDRDWAVRLKAAAMLKTFEPAFDTESAIRPAPTRQGFDYASPALVAPAFSPHAYIETDKGTIQVELTVLDAPLTALNFVALARKGFFTNVAIHRVVPNFVAQGGDPRGDGEGGPGYTIRDELNQRPYLRGTVGMALDGADTGGSQFFITGFPQPHLDARYTVFGRVVEGFDVLDRLQQWDTITRVRVWDGKSW
jgi:HEAT repeat protein/cyclophilin family peptidyl-prolyl cis-trans isomerase